MKVAVFTNLYKNYSLKHFLSTIKKLRNKSIDVFIDEKSIEKCTRKAHCSQSWVLSLPLPVGLARLRKSACVCVGGWGGGLASGTSGCVDFPKGFL